MPNRNHATARTHLFIHTSMTVSGIVLKATRRIHTAAVRVHCAALRAGVYFADKQAQLAAESADIAAALAEHAKAEAVGAHVGAALAAKHSLAVYAAAQAEASSIGGKL
uniref:Uncharacterized protein n=2 Tax=Ralstonia syzygii TaxID=28097 RepID=G2ZVX7_9RALS|nr:hypothetical protein BDB_mp60424 [blood disease bacterium R229]